MDFFRRRSKQKPSLNLLPFMVLGADGAPTLEAMGWARNISGAGVLLETSILLKPGQDLLLSIGLMGEAAKIRGHIVHIEPVGEDWFWAGIEFTPLASEGKQMLERYLEAFSQFH